MRGDSFVGESNENCRDHADTPSVYAGNAVTFHPWLKQKYRIALLHVQNFLLWDVGQNCFVTYMASLIRKDFGPQ